MIIFQAMTDVHMAYNDCQQLSEGCWDFSPLLPYKGVKLDNFFSQRMFYANSLSQASAEGRVVLTEYDVQFLATEKPKLTALASSGYLTTAPSVPVHQIRPGNFTESEVNMSKDKETKSSGYKTRDEKTGKETPVPLPTCPSCGKEGMEEYPDGWLCNQLSGGCGHMSP